MKTIKVIGLLAIMIFMILITVFVFIQVINELGITEQEYKSHLNKDVIINNDTLKVIDYSLIRKTFKLSNGLEVDETLINKIDSVR